MNPAQFTSRYTGARVMPFAPPMGHSAPGTCGSCGQPSGQCRCGCRECRKESKELLVEAAAQTKDIGNVQTAMAAAFQKQAGALAGTANPTPGTASAFIGGGCCVHLSIEYAPVTPTAATIVFVVVRDSEGTTLAWMRQDSAGGHYQVKENIITTKPGATVTILVSNATARLRWCEIFSC
jgi:hypothetical protein